MAGLIAVVAWIYLVTCRLFLQQTPGEWVVDQRLGWPQQATGFRYLFQVMWRTTILVGTGLVPLTVLSLVFQRDFVGFFSGIHLLKKI